MGAGAGGVNISTPREKGIAFPLRHHICGSPFSLFFFFLISLISYLLSSSGPIFLSFLGSFCLFLVGWLVGWLVPPGFCLAVCRYRMDLGPQWYSITTHQRPQVVDRCVASALSTLFFGLLKPRILVPPRLNIMCPP